MVPPSGIEPELTAPEAVALSITQRGHKYLGYDIVMVFKRFVNKFADTVKNIDKK